MFRITAVAVRFYSPSPLAWKDGNNLVQFGADIVQPHAVFGGIPGGKLAVGHELPVDLPTGLVIKIVMNTIAVRNEPQAVSKNVQGITE